MAQAEGVQFTLSEIAARLGGDVLGNGQTPIRCVATLASAAAGDIAFLANRKYKSQLQSTRAAAVILASDAADAFAGPRIVGPEVKAAMQAILGDIKSGAFAKAWVDEYQAGAPRFTARREAERTQPLEEVGAKLRALMPFLDAVTVKPGD